MEVATPPVRRAPGLELPWLEIQLPRELAEYTGSASVTGLAGVERADFAGGRARLEDVELASCTLGVQVDGRTATADLGCLAGGWSLLPAVLVALFAGVIAGAAMLSGRIDLAIFEAFDVAVSALADPDHAKVVVFTLLMGGLVGVVTANGGARGLLTWLGGGARTPRQSLLTTWFLGMLVFIDDYASSLLVGSTMRPVTDRWRISREKLSYVVDSTAAPITSLALVSTWVGYELSVMQAALDGAGIAYGAYRVFLEGLASRFYPWFALAFVGLVAWTGRDFGPMRKAEQRARATGDVLRPGGTPLMDADALAVDEATPRAWLGAAPIGVLLATVGVVLALTGLEGVRADPAAWAEARADGWTRALGTLLGEAASFDALVHGSGLAVAVGVIASVAARALTVESAVEAVVRGMRATLVAVLVLVLAWSIGDVMSRLQAGPYLASALGSALPAWSLPTLTFLCAALLAFATGTSWGTMAILFPVITPLLAMHGDAPGFEPLLFGTCSSVLAGAVFGDHCSPISDTTVLSSVACAADHVDHTRTQAPYAITVAGVAIACGTLPLGFGLPAGLGLAVGLGVLAGILWVVGRRPDAEPAALQGAARDGPGDPGEGREFSGGAQ
jgi:Na+/H+ antiporter NhaC